jgi:hypothetical protein
MFWSGCLLLILGISFLIIHFWGSRQTERIKMGTAERLIMEVLEAVGLTVIFVCLLIASSSFIKALLNG